MSWPALGPTQPLIQWVLWERKALSTTVKRPGREADQPPASSAEIKNEWRCTSSPLYAFMACTVTTLALLFPYSKPVARFYGRILFVLPEFDKVRSDKVHPYNRPRRPTGGVDVQLYSFFNPGFRCVGWSTPRSGKDPVPIL